jgi:PST family polysaccharide transporter
MIAGLIRNAGWLGAIQILNYVLPVLTLPVVTRAFGPSTYGSLATINALAAYIGIVVSFGLNFTGPRLVVSLRERPEELSAALSAVISMQAIAGIVAAASFTAVVFFIKLGSYYRLVSLIILFQACFASITPDWAFLGLERMRDFVLAQTIVRCLATLCIIVLIRTPTDVVLFVAINCFAALLTAVASFAMLTLFGIRWKIPVFTAIVEMTRPATALFLSAVSISLYTSTNVIIVNLLLGPGAAGPFALADRLRGVAGAITGPITSAVYPVVCRISVQPKLHQEAWAKRTFFRAVLALSALVSIGLFVFAPAIIHLAGGPAFTEAVPILHILAILPFFIALSNILGMQTMMPLGLDWSATWIFAIAGILGITGILILTPAFGLRGAASAAVLAEAFVVLSMIVVLRNNRIKVLSLLFDID